MKPDAGQMIAPVHRRYFEERGIPTEDAVKNGFYSVDSTEAQELLGYELPEEFAGIAMQSPINDYVRVRVDEPQEGARYLAPKDVEVSIWARTEAAQQSEDAIYVTEAPTKAMALGVHGLAAIGLGGVSTTLTTDERERPVLGASWDALGDLDGRRVFIVFDANRRTNLDVARAENRLGEALEAAGAEVRVVQLDTVVEDVGPDDYIMEEGFERFMELVESSVPFGAVARVAAASELALLLEDTPWLLLAKAGTAAKMSRIRKALKLQGFSTREFDRGIKELSELYDDGAFIEPVYEEINGRIVKFRDSRTPGQVLVEGTLKLTAEWTTDLGDGGTTKKFMIEGVSKDGRHLGIKAVTAGEMESRSWVLEKFGTGIPIHGSPYEVSTALQCLATNVTKTTVYGHTGWRKRGDKWVYLHGNGAVGGRAHVKLDGTVARYRLPNGAEEPEKAVALLLKLQEVSSPDVGVLLLGAFALAPLAEVLPLTMSYALIGPTGSFKTSLAAVVLGCFGDFDASQMTESWESTSNAIEHTLFIAKDVLVVVDDLLRDSTGRRMQTANSVVRKAANRSCRGRMQADGSRRADLPPRGLLLLTGEELPDSEQSNVARLLSARPDKAKVNLPVLSELQRQRDRLPHATHDYIHHLAPRLDELRKQLPDLVVEHRNHYQELKGRHARLATGLSELRSGLEVLEEFMKERGVLDAASAAAFRKWAVNGLSILADNQGVHTEATDPVQLAIDTLVELETQGKVFIAKSGSPSRSHQSSGDLIGWREPDGTLALTKRPTYAAISGAFARMGERFPISSSELWQRLLERGWLVPSSGDRPTEHQLVLGGRRRKVVRLRLPDHMTHDTPTEVDAKANTCAIETDGHAADLNVADNNQAPSTPSNPWDEDRFIIMNGAEDE